MRSPIVILCLVLLPTAAHRISAEIPVTIRTIDGHVHSGKLTAIDEAEALVNADGADHHIAITAILELTVPESQSGGTSAQRPVFLANGDRLSVDVLRLHDDQLVCRWRDSDEGPVFEVPLESVLGLVLQPVARQRQQLSLERELQRREFRNDVLFLINGDRLTGVLEELDQESCRCETSVGVLDVNRSRVRAIGFNADLLAPFERPETRLVVHLRDSSWLTCRTVSWNGETDLQVMSVTGAQIPIPVHRLRSIRCYGPLVVPLSDVESAETVMTPYLSRETPPQRNRNAHGGPLRLRGRTFANGLGMSSRTVTTYDLDGAFSEFRTVVGIDDAADGGGSVIFAVDVDGKCVFESGLVTGLDEPLPIGPIDLRHAQSMSLSVNYGIEGDIRDLADWCHPVLIREEQLGSGD